MYSPSVMKPARGQISHQLAEIDPEFYQFLQENDSKLLEMSESDAGLDEGCESELAEGDESPDNEDIGDIEPRPLHVTSRKHVSHCLLLVTRKVK